MFCNTIYFAFKSSFYNRKLGKCFKNIKMKPSSKQSRKKITKEERQKN